MINYQRGSLPAFELLYQRHKGASYRYFLRQCKEKCEAEDLMQELWSRVIKAKDVYQQQALFTTWFYRIAHNLVVDHQRHFSLVESSDDRLEAPSLDQPIDQLLQHQLATQLDHCLAKLPSTQLEVFLLKQETSLTMTQIADVASASLEATKSRLRYAMSALRNCLSLKRSD